MQKDFGALLPQFLAEQCQDWREETGPGSRGNHQGIRELGQEWQAWLLLHGANHRERRALTTPWLKHALAGLGWKVSHHHGRVVVCNLSLPSRRPPVPEGPVRDVAAKGFTAALKNDLLLDLPPALAQHIPLAGATALHRPPDDEILRRFLDDCCTCEEPRAHLSADDGALALLSRREGQARQRRRRPRSPYHTRVLFLLLARAFAQWLDEQGTTPSLRRLCSSAWLKRALERRGYARVYGETGLVFLGGITLLPAVAQRVPDRPRQVKGRDGVVRSQTTGADRMARYQRYLARKEYAARLAAGFPESVAREAFSMNLLPVSPSVLARQATERARQRLSDAAQQFVQETLEPCSPTVCGPFCPRLSRCGKGEHWHRLRHGFRSFLRARALQDRGAPSVAVLRAALTAYGAVLGDFRGRPGRGHPFLVANIKFRVSPGEPENRVHSREVVGYAGSGAPFD